MLTAHEFQEVREFSEIQAESIDWIPLQDTAYLQIGSDASNNPAVINLVVIPKPEMQVSTVLWVF